MVTNMCSTSPPGGNQFEGLPPVSNTAVMDMSFNLESILLESFALVFENASVVRIVN
jgi:hypothetical protein